MHYVSVRAAERERAANLNVEGALKTEAQYLSLLSLLALIWTKQTKIGLYRGDTHAHQLAVEYHFLRQE